MLRARGARRSGLFVLKKILSETDLQVCWQAHFLTRLVQATNVTFYGTTYGGGTDGYGTVFSLSVGLGPFVETLPII
jgi:uncharacterized repeat protein (TIGR03803 family)